MTKVRNQRIWSDDQEFLKNIADEQENYIGRPFHLDLKNGVITIFALPQKRHKKKKESSERDKRKEKFERN